MSPVLKYYVHEDKDAKKPPKYARFWVDKEYPIGDDNFNTDKDVSFLSWCIKGSLHTDIVYEIIPIENKYYNVWGY